MKVHQAARMKAAVLVEPGKPLALRDMPVPQPGAGEVQVKLSSCGICHSDLHLADGDWPVTDRLPLILGHEGVGEISALGAAVGQWNIGDRVGIPLINKTCGKCDLCRQGVETLCIGIRLTGYHVHGCFAEYVLVDSQFAVALPDEPPGSVIAPMLCAGVTVYRGIKQTRLLPAQWLAIWGTGGLGHLAVRYAKAFGLKVIAVDIHPDKLAMARRSGADVTINSLERDPVAAIMQVCDGAHGALVTATSAEPFQQAYQALRPNGVFTPLGICPGEFRTSIMDIMTRQITIKGSSTGTREDMKECLSFAAEHSIEPETRVYDFDSINEALDDLRRNRLPGRGVVRVG